MHTLTAHWIDIQSYIQAQIDTRTMDVVLQDWRTSTRSRRLWFYFFESEITDRVRQEVSSHVDDDAFQFVFSHPELQALAQRA